MPSYYLKHGGLVLAAAIDKYVYVTVNESFRNRISLKYSKVEDVATPDEVEHPIIREALKLLKLDCVDIDTIADIPAGTGMGSSGSFTTALLHALHLYKRETLTKIELAEEAFHIEHNILKQHCGRQDQYISAIGGITILDFDRHGKITCQPLEMSSETLANLEDGLMLFFTGYCRSACNLLAEQDSKTEQSDKDVVQNLNYTKELGFLSETQLRRGDLRKFAETMNVHWVWKRQRSESMTNPHIDLFYALGMKNGALGGKLVGAGGGGFLMFYSEERARLRRAMRAEGLREVRFKFDFGGTHELH